MLQTSEIEIFTFIPVHSFHSKRQSLLISVKMLLLVGKKNNFLSLKSFQLLLQILNSLAIGKLGKQRSRK